MKNAGKHAEKLKSLVKGYLKEKVAAATIAEPLKALVRAAMTYDVPDAKADEAMKHIEAEFVDLNELRVATDLEIQELLGVRYPEIQRRVEMITRCLNAIFEKEHTLSLDRLKTISKRDARQFLRELPGIHPFVEAYVMMFAFEGSAFPVDEQMCHYLSFHGVLEQDVTPEEAQKFLENHLKTDEYGPVFHGLRHAVLEDGKGKKKGK